MSIREIARITGLSVATVSHVINGTRRVSEKSRDLVKKAIDETGYRPNRAARVLKTQRSNTVALVIPSVMPNRPTNLFFMNVISGAKDALEHQGYDLIVSTYTENAGGEEKAGISVLEKTWVDGMLIVPGHRRSKSVEVAAASGVPFVLVDRTVEGASCPCVYSDNYAATKKAIELFFGCGKRRIAFIGGMQGYSTGFDRFRGYSDALEALGLGYDESIVLHDVDYTLDAAHEACENAVIAGCDAIFTSNNVLTMGVLRCLAERDIAIPGEIGVIGYEDYEWMEIYNPPITTIRQQSYAMGWIGAETLLARMHGRPLNEKTVLTAPLIIRQSHGQQGQG